ncbi:MAG: glucosaminidase domain-containing protein [Phaeodactylibacter sp.]|uniref:glycoside hydrolase family 73 protein n=1 Tax=Phaeodactylibacter sp. TaxID=1940289 RepID=UPI0032EC9078
MNVFHNSTIRQLAHRAGQEVSLTIQKHWLKTALLGAAAYMAYQKDMDIDLQLNNPLAPVVQARTVPHPTAQTVAYRMPTPEAEPMNTSMVEKTAPKKTVALPKSTPRANVSNLANTYSNLTADNKGESRKEAVADRSLKRRKQKAYIKRFTKVAQLEMKKYGIPASITLAQGLLESNVGESKLATRNNNHFGMKCFSRSCSSGHCSNFTDDSHKDFFRVYKSAWESFRAHSLLLKRSSRYQPLFKLSADDYKGWARGLKKAGYATDPKYAEKIINLIEDLDLHRYDKK